MTQTIELESIKRLDIKPGETLVATLPAAMTHADMLRVKDHLVAALPPDVRLFVTSTDVDLSVLACPPGPACPAVD